MVEISKPIGFFCTKCRQGLAIGMPYLEEHCLHAEISKSVETKALARKIVDIHNQDNSVEFVTSESVRGLDTSSEKFSVNLDGYTEDEFIDAHAGISPSELNIIPDERFDRSTQQWVKLFWAPRKPKYSLQLNLEMAVRLEDDRMPTPLYQEQAQHTKQYLESKQSEALASLCPYSSHAALTKAVKQCVASKHGGSTRAPQPSTSQGRTVGESTSNPFARVSNSTTGVPPVVPAARPSATTATVLPKRLPQITFRQAVKIEPGLANPSVMNINAPKCAKSAPQMRVVAAVSGQAPIRDSVQQPIQSSLGKRRDSRSWATAIGEGNHRSVRARLCPLKQPPPRTVCDLGSASPETVELGKVAANKSFDVDSSATDIEPAANKFERACLRCAPVRSLLGANVQADIVNLRKMSKIAERESPGEWARECAETLDICIGSTNLVVNSMLQHLDDKVTVALAGKVASYCPGGKLPKLTICDMALVFAAHACLPPRAAKVDFGRFMQMCPLQGVRAGKHSHSSPSWMTDYFEDDDFFTGIVPSRFCLFVTEHVLSVMVKVVSQQSVLIQLIFQHLLPALKALPSSHSAPCYEELRILCSGFLFLAGPVPYLLDCTVEHAEKLKRSQNLFAQNVRNTAWTATLADKIYIRNAGEKTAWPEILQAVQGFKNAPESDKCTLMLESLQKYSKWKSQVRETSLPVGLHTPVLRWVTETLKAKQIQNAVGKGVDFKFEHTDIVVSNILRLLQRAKALGWSEPCLAEHLASLSSVATKLDEANASAQVIELCTAFNAKDYTEDDVIEFVHQCGAIMPSQPQMVRIAGDARRDVHVTLQQVGVSCVALWPNAAIYDGAAAILDRLELATDPILTIGGEDARILAWRDKLSLFRRLQGFKRHHDLMQDQCPLTAEIVEQADIVELSRKLGVYEKFFTQEFVPIDILSEQAVSKFNGIIESTKSHLKEFAVFAISNVESPFKKELVQLVNIGGGTADGKKWTIGMPETMDWQAFLKFTEGNLRQVNKIRLITLVQSVVMVRISFSYRNREPPLMSSVAIPSPPPSFPFGAEEVCDALRHT